MNDKKNIDRMFQERFKDFESNPDEHVWANIQLALKDKDNNRKVLPFWIKTAGIAAAFLLFFFAWNTAVNDINDNQKNVVIETKVTTNSSGGTDSTPNVTTKKPIPKKVTTIPRVLVNTIKTIEKNEKNNTSTERFNIASNKEKNEKPAAVYLQKNNSPLTPAATKLSKQANAFVVEQDGLKKDQLPKNTLQQLPFGKNDAEKSFEIIAVALDQKKQQEQSLITLKELEEILKKKTENTAEAPVINSKNKWQVTPHIAAVFLNTNAGGSAIDPQFSENQKTAENSLSIGVGIHYVVSKKLALRSGISRLSLAYNTNNVVYTTALVNNNLTNIRYSSKEAIEIKNTTSLDLLATFEKDLQKTNTGAINQKMGYYEIPLEVSYVILDKKFGINLIGGFSTLFLSQNKIALISNETKVNLGEANNLNPIHFSTNVGLGFKYKVLKSFQITMEPMLKYQLNTFSNNSGGFTPLFVGLYSGVSYSF